MTNDELDANASEPHDEQILRDFERLRNRGGLDAADALIELTRAGRQPPLLRELPSVEGAFVSSEQIGAGGMGVLYEARAPDGTRLAVKIVPQATQVSVDRFEAECTALAKLSHPGIVKYQGHGHTADGNGYLLMDLARGVSLEALLDDVVQQEPRTSEALTLLSDVDSRGPLVLQSSHVRKRLIRMLAAVADALGAAHAEGIVHGDVKPANIVVDDELTPIVVDFGLSRDLFRKISLTKSSHLMGTLSYLAPEQLNDRPGQMCSATDSYALGCVLLRCLTGAERGDTFGAYLDACKTPFVLSREIEASIPPPVQAVLYKALELNPLHRYATADLMGKDLRSSLGSSSVVARRPHRLVRGWRRSRHKLAIVVASIVSLALIVWALIPPAPCHVWVDAVNDGGELTIDGKATYLVPHRGVPVLPGRHEFVYRSNATASISTMRGTFDITKDIRFTRLNLLSRSLLAQTAPDVVRVDSKSEDPSFLLIHAPLDAVVTINGRPWERAVRWVAVDPRFTTIEARSPAGITESQRVTLQPATMSYVTLLGGPSEFTRGEFRFTLGSVLSPLPAFASLACDDGVAPFMNDFIDRSVVRPGYLTLTTCIGSITPMEGRHAVLRVQFPKAMRSIKAAWSQKATAPVGQIAVEYRTDGENWRPATEALQLEVAIPTKSFELRATMTSSQEPAGFAFSEFLSSYIDHSGHDQRRPAFALCADPQPNGTR